MRGNFSTQDSPWGHPAPLGRSLLIHTGPVHASTEPGWSLLNSGSGGGASSYGFRPMSQKKKSGIENSNTFFFLNDIGFSRDSEGETFASGRVAVLSVTPFGG